MKWKVKTWMCQGRELIFLEACTITINVSEQIQSWVQLKSGLPGKLCKTSIRRCWSRIWSMHWIKRWSRTCKYAMSQWSHRMGENYKFKFNCICIIKMYKQTHARLGTASLQMQNYGSSIPWVLEEVPCCSSCTVFGNLILHKFN